MNGIVYPPLSESILAGHNNHTYHIARIIDPTSQRARRKIGSYADASRQRFARSCQHKTVTDRSDAHSVFLSLPLIASIGHGSCHITLFPNKTAADTSLGSIQSSSVSLLIPLPLNHIPLFGVSVCRLITGERRRCRRHHEKQR